MMRGLFSQWKYFDDPTLDVKGGDIVMTTHDYRPSWWRRVWCELNCLWINWRSGFATYWPGRPNRPEASQRAEP
jgi:hypothetical protein